MINIRQILITSSIVIAILILALAATTSWYIVDESEQAVVLTFGKADQTVTEPGLKFKLPWPVQTVEKLSKETYSLHLGAKNDDKEKHDDVKMITGDENIVIADLVVQWKITDPVKFLFNADDPEAILYDATSASLRSIIGSSKIDNVLTSGRADIEGEVWELLKSLIEKYDIGISILAVKLQDVELPNKEVRKAFTDVTDARETMNTKINEAQKYRNQKLNEAEGEAAAIISRAEGEKVARLEEARGHVAVFNSLYNEYKNSPEVTRERLIIETLEVILPNARIYIMNDDGQTLKYLPLTPLKETPKRAEQSAGKKSDEKKSRKKEGSEKNE